MELNPRQLAAVREADGPCVIAAGPGTGKTRTFSHRIAHLIRDRGVPAQSILAVTFTRSAAAEMHERVQGLLPDGAPRGLRLGTFHAAALGILRESRHPFGGAEVSVVSEDDKPKLLEGIVPKRRLPALLEDVRRAKQALRRPEGEAAEEYGRRLREARLLDFDDLFLETDRLFDERPEILSRWRERVRYILVDEFQDTSFAQYALMRRLARENVCVIGDPDQAIYGFTSESFRPFEAFRRDFPACRLFPLSENYRSKGTILEAAKQVIRRNAAQLPRDLSARLERGMPIEITPHGSERQEAEMIARRIEGIIGGSSHFTIDTDWARKEEESYVYGLKDIAVLYRFHAQARRIEEALGRGGLPFRTFGRKTRASAQEELEDFRERVDSAGDSEEEGVRLMTLHRAKGLEFPVVFIAGCEDGLMPYRRQGERRRESETIEEERRLFFVGMTRAKSRLFLSYAKRRFLFGKSLERGPSPFLRDIEEELRTIAESRSKPKRKGTQPTLFDP